LAGEIVEGQPWSIWTASRRQWLLARVIDVNADIITLKFDPAYGVDERDNTIRVEAGTMLSAPNLFRFVPGGA